MEVVGEKRDQEEGVMNKSLEDHLTRLGLSIP